MARERAVRALKEMGKGALEYGRTQAGKVRAPQVSPRLAARIKKEMVLNGHVWPYGENEENKQNWRALKPSKGHRRAQNARVRQAKVEQGMVHARELREQAEQQKQRKRTELLTVYDRLFTTKRQQTKRLRSILSK